jgi:hypothetical protein
MLRIIFAVLIGLAMHGASHAADAPLKMDQAKAKALFEQIDGYKPSPDDGRPSIAAPTVLAYSASGTLLHVSAMREISAENLLEDRLTDHARASRYFDFSGLAEDIQGLERDPAQPVFVMIFPPQARVFCEPCRTARATLESLLSEQKSEAAVVEVDVVFVRASTP